MSGKIKQKSRTKTSQALGTKNGMQNLDRIIPAKITKKQEKTIKDLALKIFRVTNSKGVVRIDFMIDEKLGRIYANEINTIPGSFAFYLWEKSGIDFQLLIDKLVQIAENTKKQSEKIASTFTSSVLSGTNINLMK